MIKSLLTEIINMGYTPQYIYYVMDQLFWNPKENIDVPQRINLFFDSFSLEIKEYEVIFIVDKSKMYKFIKFIDGWDLKDSLSPRSEMRKEIQFLNIKEKQSFISLKIKSYDQFGAAEKARDILSINISVFRLYNHEYRYNINTAKCGVYENKIFYRIPSSKSAVEHTRMPSDKQINESMEHSAKVIEIAMANNNLELTLSIMKAIEFHSHSLDSISKENQLLDLWAIFESTLNISNKHTSDRIQQICMHLVPILKRKYLYSLFKQLSIDIKRYSEEKYNMIICDANDEKTIVQKVCEFVLLPEHMTKRADLFSKCEDFPLLVERIQYYSEKLHYNSIHAFVEKHADRVRWQVMRIYRNRNLIVHNGETMPYLNLLIENLHSYVDEFIEYIIKKSLEGHTINSIYQELYIKECHWNSLFSSKKKEMDSEIIKAILSN